VQVSLFRLVSLDTRDDPFCSAKFATKSLQATNAVIYCRQRIRDAVNLPQLIKACDHSSGQRMVNFEFGQDRLTQPHPLNTFELAQDAIKVPFVLFSTTLLGLVGFVLQKSLFFCRTSWRGKNHASRYATSTLSAASS
jgi:hypothetical protein